VPRVTPRREERLASRVRRRPPLEGLPVAPWRAPEVAVQPDVHAGEQPRRERVRVPSSCCVWRKLASVAVDVGVLVKQGNEPLAAGRRQFGPSDLLVIK
jgi:hypothetical protein